MINYNFDKNIKETLEKHGVNNPELESSLNDLFRQFEERILSEQFIKEISVELNRHIQRTQRSRGIIR